jgi:hypothetical protein
MTFVKVVGGTEIYNFRIQSFMHFYTKFWSFSILNKGSATRWARTPTHRNVVCARAPRVVPARRPASTSAPRAAQGHTLAQACPFPMRRAPRPMGVLPAARTPRTAPYRLGARHGPSVHRRRPPYARRPRPPCHGRIFKVMPSSARVSCPI